MFFQRLFKILIFNLFTILFISFNGIGGEKFSEEKSIAVKIFAVALGHVKEDMLAYSASRCDLIILSTLTYPTPPNLIRKCNKNIKILGYCETMSTDTRYDNFDELNKHEDWFLHDKGGKRIKVYIYKTDSRFGMDKTNGEYQKWLADKCKKIADRGYDGVFLDNIGVTLGYRNPFKYSGFPEGMDNEKWQKGSRKLLEKIKSALGKEKIVVFNQIAIDDGFSTFFGLKRGMGATEASLSFTEVCDGAMKEDFFRNGRDIGENFFKLLDLLKTLNKKNKYTLCLSRGNSGEDAKLLYCLYLLAIDRENAYFSYQKDYKKITWFNFYNLDLGQPIEDYSKMNGIGMRRFQKGIVVVNCNRGSKTVKLPREYKDKKGEKVKEILIGSKQGKILFN